nr:reverse transcriptase domain-containing protein [Tanacetum cinerariifolium]
MRTRSRSRSRNNSPQREASPAIVEPLRIELPFLEDQFQENTPLESPMADNRTMAELLQVPTEGYEDAIIIPEITANNFELKHASPFIVEPLRIELPFLEDQSQEDPPLEVSMADKRTMAELLQAPTEGYEDAIVIPEIAAKNFELKHGLINLVQNKQFFRHDKEDPHAHIRYFNKITSTMRVPNVPSSAIKLMLFPFSLEGAACILLEKEAPRSIQTWDDLVSKFINQFFPPSKTTNLRNEIMRFQQRFDELFYEAWEHFNDLLKACPHHRFSELHQLDTFYNALNTNDQDSLNSAAGGNFLDKIPRECLKISKSKSKVHQLRAKAVVAKVSTSSSTPAISSDVAELKDMVKALLLDKKNQSPAPTPSTTPAQVKTVEPNCVTCGGAHSYKNYPATYGNAYRDNIQEYVSQAATTNYNQGNIGFRPQMVANQIQPPGSKYAEPVPKHSKSVPKSASSNGHFDEHDVQIGTLPGNTITNPKEDLKGITTRSGVAYQGPKTPSPSKQGTKVTKNQVQTPSLQNTAPVQPSVIQSKSQAPVSEPVVAPVGAPMPNLKPSIPYPSRRDNENHRMDECLAMADLGASINLMPFSMCEVLSLLKLTPTYMNLELVDRSISKQIGIAKDVSFKVGVFQFPADFVVVDFELDPRVPLILERYFLKTGRALIDMHKGELTLRIGKESITYNLDQTVRYSANYDQMTANKIDVICEIYFQEVLSFSDVTTSGSPTPDDDLIVSATSSTLTPFGDSDFLLFEEADAFLGLEDDPDSPKINPFYYDPEEDILLLETILNSKSLPPLPNHEQYLPLYKKELKVCEVKTIKSSVDEPPKVKLKDLPHHLEYAFLEGDNKLPVIIAIELGDEEKSALIKLLKSHKRAIAWKLSDIQGGFTVVENEENELIPTRLVTRWQVCIDYCKLNEATRKDHFPLPFMDQMLERLAENEYYCFLDGFSRYFQIPIDPRNQEKTTFTCPYGMFAYHRMPFSLCNAPGTFQRCMLAIFHDMVEKTMEVFMDDFSIFRNSFENFLSRLDKMLQWCEDTNLSLNWEKSHFMVKEGIVLGHKNSKNMIEVKKAKINVIAKLPHPTIVKGVQSFLGHAGFTDDSFKIFPKSPDR